MRQPNITEDMAASFAQMRTDLEQHLSGSVTIKRNFPTMVAGSQVDDYRVFSKGTRYMILDNGPAPEAPGMTPQYGSGSTFTLHLPALTDIILSDRVMLDDSTVEYEVTSIGAPNSNEPMRRVNVTLPRSQDTQ